MRITHQMLSRNYLTRMNGNLSRLTGSNEKLSDGRKFNKGYENVADAGKALKIRKLLADNGRYQTTIRDAQGRADAAEDALRTINTLLIATEDKVIEGLNGTVSPNDREKIAIELEKYQEEIFQVMNTKYSDRFLFTAAGNLDGSAPFSKGPGGELLYQGIAVDGMFPYMGTGQPGYQKTDDTGVLVNAPIPYNKKNYVDIGAGFRLLPNGEVDPNTAFQDTYSGVDSFGFGVNADGMPRNAYSLLGRMVENLRANNLEGLGKTLNAIPDAMDFVLTAVTEIGARGVTLQDSKSRLEGEYINLIEIQNDLEGVDYSEEIIHNKSFEMSWMVTLQLGSKILPQTIFDFIR